LKALSMPFHHASWEIGETLDPVYWFRQCRCFGTVPSLEVLSGLLLESMSAIGVKASMLGAWVSWAQCTPESTFLGRRVTPHLWIKVEHLC
jgi:hypothetical protein